MDPRNLNEDQFWQQKTSEEKIRFLLRYAILAPSTHNTQPWLFKITDNVCYIYYDKKYFLPEADPKGRDLYISMGCMLENLTIATKFFNVFEVLETNKDLFTDHVATLKISKKTPLKFNEDYRKLLVAILKRKNARGFFSITPDGFDVVQKIVKDIPIEYTKMISVTLISDKEKINKISNLTAEGLQTAYKSRSFRREMSKWMKNSLTKDKDGLPGYALKMPLLLSFLLPTLVRYLDIGNFLGKINKKSLSSAPLIAVLSSSQSTPVVWIDVGRIAERIMLEINAQGLNTSIFVASIEIGNLHNKLREIVGINDEPQFLFAVGKINSVSKPTPRHQLEKKLL